MIQNILYKKLKKMISIMHIYQWLKIIIDAKFKEACIKTSTIKSLKLVHKVVFLDHCFCTVPFYPTWKIFKKYSKMKYKNRSKY